MKIPFLKIIILLLPLVILFQNCKRNSYANADKGTYLFTVTDSIYQANTAPIIETHTYTGDVTRVKYRTVQINYDTDHTITRKLDNLGEIIAQETGNQESGKFQGKHFIYRESNTSSAGWWSISVVGEKQK